MHVVPRLRPCGAFGECRVVDLLIRPANAGKYHFRGTFGLHSVLFLPAALAARLHYTSRHPCGNRLNEKKKFSIFQKADK